MIKSIMQHSDYMIKIDHKDAYQCVPMHQRDRQFMRSRWGQFLCQYLCLPFGLASAPRQFTRLRNVTVGFIRKLGVRLLMYPDDVIMFHLNPHDLITDMNSLVYLLENLGFVVNRNKSHMSLTNQIEYLGVNVNSITMQSHSHNTKWSA